MKKLLALLLCLCMALSFAVPAFASDAAAFLSAVTELTEDAEPTEDAKPTEDAELTQEADAPGEAETSQTQDSLLAEITEEKTDDSIPSTEDDPNKNNTDSDGETSGSLTNTIDWALDADYVLTITGTGEMPDYDSIGKTPWFAHYDKITAVVIGEGITYVGSSSFAYCSAIASVSLPEGLESIGDSAFNGLEKLTSIAFPESLKTIGEFAFSFNGLTVIELPAGLETLGESAFNPSNAITELTLPGGLTSVGAGAFGVCEKLTTITVEEGITHLGDCFINCYAVETLNLPSTIQTMDHNFILLESAALKTIRVAADEANEFAFDCWADETGATFTSEELIAGAEYSGDLTAYWTYVGEGFSDVRESHWYYDYVMYCYENGLMAGMENGAFEPASSATRAQVVMVLYRLADEPEVTASSSFSDVKSGDWFHDAVVWAAENGIAVGYPDNTFAPNTSVTREEFLVFLHRFTKDKGLTLNEWSKLYDIEELNISDTDSISSWALEAQTWSLMVGLQAGYENSDGSWSLNPLGYITRAELATFLSRYYSEIGLYACAEACQYLMGYPASYAVKTFGEADETIQDSNSNMEWWCFNDYGVAILVNNNSDKQPITDWKYI